MSSSNPAGEEQSTILRRWLSALPGHIDYEHNDDTVSRQEYLEAVINAAASGSIAVVYLQDQDNGNSFLTLAYAAGFPRGSLTLPRRLPLNYRNSAKAGVLTHSNQDFEKFASDHAFGAPLTYVLSEYRHPLPNKSILTTKDVGIAVIFLPKSVEADSAMKTKLQIAWRLFAVEAARSRHQRLSLAISKMLEAINDSSEMDTLSGILSKYCRSQSVYLYERRGSHYTVVGKTHRDSKRSLDDAQSVEVQQVSKIIDRDKILRSHVFAGRLPQKLKAIVGESAWMLLPCFTEGINVLSGTNTRYPQYLLLLVDKENTEYLGEDYSFTDLTIGQSLVSLLSNHVPYMGLTEKLSEIHKELDRQLFGEFDLKWYSALAMQHLPGLRSIAVFPDFPSNESAKFNPTPFTIDESTIRSSQSPRANEACLGAETPSSDKLNCLIFRIATEYRNDQKIVFAFTDQFVQNAQMQILNVLVEYARSVFSVADFREYHIATQAQIRHVIRGSLAAAISDLGLVHDRIRLFSRMPTKLTKLLGTPTMRDSMSDTLLWLNEAYSLADAPRYLLDSFDSSSVRWSDVNPAALIRSVLAISKGEIRRRGLRIEFAPDADADSRVISADPQFMKIVLFNLIDNAVKYSFQDKWLRLELIYSQARWRFEVENLGVPISGEDREKIFQPWVRSFRQQVTTRRPGTGLGLAVSRRILEAHDEGAIFDFTSDVISEGETMAKTTFFFELDLKGKHEGDA